MSDMVRAWLGTTQRLDGAATPGPWETVEDTARRGHITAPVDDPEEGTFVTHCEECRGYVLNAANAEWTVHARTALPQATAALRAVLDLCDQWDAEASELLSGAPGVVCDEAFKVRATITAALTSHQHPTPLGSSGKCDHEARGVTWAEGDTTAYACETCEHEWTERD